MSNQKKTNILVLFTCFNRCNYTKRAIIGLVNGNSECDFHFIAVDDASKDGTLEMLESLQENIAITIVNGTGDLFYSGGMRIAMEKAFEIGIEQFDYVMLMNDDVLFENHAIEKLLIQSRLQYNSVIVGVCSDDEGMLSYGAIKYIKGIKYDYWGTDKWQMSADTFNANCVLIPRAIFEKVPIMDAHYVHSLGDFDYGLAVSRAGYDIHTSQEYVGICNDNPQTNSWHDKSLSRIERIKRKESVKGDPAKLWFYYLKKNFGIGIAIYKTITPFVRILLGK